VSPSDFNKNYLQIPSDYRHPLPGDDSREKEAIRKLAIMMLQIEKGGHVYDFPSSYPGHIWSKPTGCTPEDLMWWIEQRWFEDEND